MNRLEERYRRVLRLLPRPYRRTWEDDMVAAFLETMDSDDPEAAAYAADYGRPSLGEVASVASLAVRLRFGGADAPPRPFAWGQAVRLATLMIALTHAVFASAGIAVSVWLSGKVGWLPTPSVEEQLARPSGVAYAVAAISAYAWLTAYVALVLGHRRVAQGLALLAIAPPAITVAVLQAAAVEPLSVSPWATAFVDLLLVVAMGAFGRTAPPVRRGPWLLAVPVGLLLVPGPLLAVQSVGDTLRFLDWPGLACALVTAAMVGYLVSRAVVRGPRPPAWPLALTLVGGTALGLRLVTLPQYGDQVAATAPLTTALAQAMVVLAVGIPVGVLAGRGLRRLPAQPATTPTPVG